MSILFINGSPNKNGNTVDIAKILLKDKKESISTSTSEIKIDNRGIS